MRRRLAVLLSLSVLLAAGCGDTVDGGGGTPDAVDGQWRLTSGIGPDGEVEVGEGVEVTLEVDGSSWGGTVCNQYGADEVTIGDGTVAFGEVFRTEMACADQRQVVAENAYLAAFAEVSGYTVDGDALTLTGPDTDLVFERVEPAAASDLVGTVWTLDTLITGRDAMGTASSVAGAPTLQFHDDGGFRAATGCNEATGDYEIVDATLVTGEVEVTEQGCDGPWASQEDHIADVLIGDPAFAIEGQRLTLTSGDLGLSYTTDPSSGDEDAATGDTAEAAPDPAGDPVAVSDTDLDVVVSEVEVEGLDGITATALGGGTLRAGEPLMVFVRLDGDAEVSIRDFVFAAVATRREGPGTGSVGIRGICGYGWHADGTRITEDPCAAAEPATTLSPETDMTLGLTLHPITDAGPALSGTHRAVLPLDESMGSRISLTLELIPSGQRPLPPWPDETVELRVNFEEVDEPVIEHLRVAVIDGYGRVLEQVDAADHRDAGAITVQAPVDVPWRLRAEVRDGDGWDSCGASGQRVIYESGDEPRNITLIADGCAPGR